MGKFFLLLISWFVFVSYLVSLLKYAGELAVWPFQEPTTISTAAPTALTTPTSECILTCWCVSLFGLPWVGFGRVLGACRTVLGASLCVLGASWGPIGPSGGPLGASWVRLGASCGVSKPQESPKRLPKGPKRRPRGVQEASKRPQDAPKSPQEVPKRTPKRHPNDLQELLGLR